VVDELGLDDLATGGEDEGYVPCDEGPATDTDLGADALAVAGEDGGFTPVGTGAASAPADESDTVAIFGTSSGFVAKPCSEITCVAQDTFTRVEAFGLGTSEFGPPWTSATGSSVDGSVGHVLGGSIPRVVLPFVLPVEILTKQRLNRGSGGYPTLAFDFFGGMTIHKGGSPSFTNLYWQLALFVYNAGFLGDNPGIPWSDTDVVLKVLARDEIGNVGSSAKSSCTAASTSACPSSGPGCGPNRGACAGGRGSTATPSPRPTPWKRPASPSTPRACSSRTPPSCRPTARG
jgi:hypothetical protein